MKTIFLLLALLAVFGVGLLTAPSAAALTVTATNGTPTSTGATIIGTNTCTNLVAGVTNAVSITLFYGAHDGGTSVLNWPNAIALTNVFTSGQAYTNTLAGLSPNTIIAFRARAQDLAGEAWSEAGAFTTAVSAAFSPDKPFRENIRTGTVVLATAVIGGTNYTVGVTNFGGNLLLKLTP